MSAQLTKAQIRETEEYKKCKKDIEEAVETNGSYTYQVIAFGLKSLKSKFGHDAVEMMADEVPDIHDHVVINPSQE